jgi:CDP-diacylglycerol--serine O-phosphatidyltransferase
MVSKKRQFFKRRRPQDGEEFPGRPPKKRLPMAKMRKGVVILPSLLTLTSIFFAFYSLVESVKDNFAFAAALILVASFFDGIDGKVARLTNTTTRFGVELDSLADVISFGVCPAILMYKWALFPYAQIGWVFAFVYVACGALRLARFNVQTGTIDPKKFNGLPIPAAAAMLCTTVLFFHSLNLNPADFRLALLILTLVIAFMMVSSIKFHAFKDLTLVREKPFTSTVGFVLLLALIAAAPFVVPFLLCAGYLFSGPIMTAFTMMRNYRQKQIKATAAETPHEPEISAEHPQ